jgi:hypothetical protein
MKSATAFAVLVLVSAATIALASFVPLAQDESVSNPVFSVQFVRTGGIYGAHDVLLIDGLGDVSYTSAFGPAFNASLSQDELASLEGTVAANIAAIHPTSIHPKGGAADFFSYGLTVTIGDKTTTLSWVDEWASAEPFPAELHVVQQTLQNVTRSFLTTAA